MMPNPRQARFRSQEATIRAIFMAFCVYEPSPRSVGTPRHSTVVYRLDLSTADHIHPIQTFVGSIFFDCPRSAPCLNSHQSRHRSGAQQPGVEKLPHGKNASQLTHPTDRDQVPIPLLLFLHLLLTERSYDGILYRDAEYHARSRKGSIGRAAHAVGYKRL